MAKAKGTKQIAANRKAYHDYFVDDKYEAVFVQRLLNKFNLLLVPGTTIELILPSSKQASTSVTYPNFLPLDKLITSLCLKSMALPSNILSPQYINFY